MEEFLRSENFKTYLSIQVLEHALQFYAEALEDVKSLNPDCNIVIKGLEKAEEDKAKNGGAEEEIAEEEGDEEITIPVLPTKVEKKLVNKVVTEAAVKLIEETPDKVLVGKKRAPAQNVIDLEEKIIEDLNVSDPLGPVIQASQFPGVSARERSLDDTLKLIDDEIEMKRKEAETVSKKVEQA